MKICLFDGCNRNSFSHGYCQVHQYKRTDSKAIEARNKPVEPRSTIRPHKRTTSDKSELKTTKSELMQSWGFKNQKEMFDFVWQTREHVCQFTGLNLDTVPESRWHWMFLHILPKGLYPYFKFNPDNIVLGNPDFHVRVDNYIDDYRSWSDWNYDLFFQMQEEQKQKYRDFLILNQL